MSTIENGSCDRDVSQPGPTEFASNAPLVLRYDNDNAGGIRDGHGFYDEDSHQGTTPSFDISATSAAEATTTVTPAGSTTTRTTTAWEPSGIWWRDMLYFVGPGKCSCHHTTQRKTVCWTMETLRHVVPGYLAFLMVFVFPMGSFLGIFLLIYWFDDMLWHGRACVRGSVM